jgi:hypothetical protein
MPRRSARRIATVLAVLAGAVVTGCTRTAAAAHHTDIATATVPQAAAASTVIPTQSRTQKPGPPSEPAAPPGSTRPAADLSTAPAHDPARAVTRDPVSTARAWAVAAHSSSYRDPTPGTWTRRTAPFVTGREQATERVQRVGDGGATWTLITTSRCIISLRQLSAGMPSDAPTGPAVRIVYLTGLTALTCTTGQVQLAPFTAQLTITRRHGRWFVAAVTH